MPSDKSNHSEKVAEAEKKFRKLVLDSYDLDTEFVDKLGEFYTSTVTELVDGLSVPKAKRNTTGKPKTKRKKSAYNVFVREMMKTEDIQELDHKEKMSAIAKLWKAIEADEKEKYTQMAADENAAAAEPVEASA